MENDDLPAIGPGADLDQMAPLNQRRSVTFMNHFLTHTANFLNKFANMAEDRLSQQSLAIQRLEIALNILEAKLDSIPGLDDIKVTEESPPQHPTTETRTVEAAPQTVSNDREEHTETGATIDDANVLTVKDDERYKKYLKMVNVGVPKAAVRNKMISEGLDPDLLDNPDAPVLDGGAMEQDSDNESQSLSSGDDDFSD